MFQKIIAFLKDVKTEMNKVSWPSKNQIIRLSLVVIGMSLAVAIFLGALDFIFTLILNLVV